MWATSMTLVSQPSQCNRRGQLSHPNIVHDSASLLLLTKLFKTKTWYQSGWPPLPHCGSMAMFLIHTASTCGCSYLPGPAHFQGHPTSFSSCQSQPAPSSLGQYSQQPSGAPVLRLLLAGAQKPSFLQLFWGRIRNFLRYALVPKLLITNTIHASPPLTVLWNSSWGRNCTQLVYPQGLVQLLLQFLL